MLPVSAVQDAAWAPLTRLYRLWECADFWSVRRLEERLPTSSFALAACEFHAQAS